MSLTVVGVFDNATEAQQAVENLVNEGFSRSSIDLSTQTAQIGEYANTDGSLVPDRHKNTSGTRTEEVVDDTKDVGSSIGNFFSSLFGDDDDTTSKYNRVGDRSSIVTVHAQDENEAERAADVLDDSGAVDVDERDEQYRSGTYAGTGSQVVDSLTTAPSASMGAAFMDTDNRTDMTDRTLSTDNDQTIKVIEENLEVGKRSVERGGVRLRSRIIERPVEESVRLREERVSIQRNPVNRPATDADLNAFREGEITMTEHAEVPVVSKTANVVEEISVNKNVTERDEVIRDTVRKTDVDVEQLGSTETRTDRTGLSNDDVTYSK